MNKILLTLSMAFIAQGLWAANELVFHDGLWYWINHDKKVAGVAQHYHLGYDDELIGDGGVGYTGDIVIPSSVDGNTVIGILSGAFKEATGVTSITIPTTLKYIGDFAFQSCDIPEITIPANVDSIADYAFWKCDLQKLTFEDGDNELYLGKSGINMFIDSDLNEVYLGRNLIGYPSFSSNNLKHLTVGNKVTGIADSGFHNCSELQTVVLGSGITYIGKSAFQGCSALESINLPEGITEIRSTAFRGCTSLKSLKLPSTLTTIQGFAFQGCVFPEISIPANVETIEDYGFWTDDLKKITFEDGDKPITVGTKNFLKLEEAYIGRNFGNNFSPVRSYSTLKKVTCGDDAILLVDNMFQGCSNLEEVTLGNIDILPTGIFSGCTALTRFSSKKTPKTIGENAFYSCRGLTHIRFENGLETIGDRAFYGCSNLKRVVLPATLTTIGNNAFYSDTSIEAILCYATTPPTCSNKQVFNYLNTAECALYVPKQSENAYREADVWKDFFIQEMPEATAIEATETDAANQDVSGRWYTIDGRLLPEAPTKRGLYIHNGKKVVK